MHCFHIFENISWLGIWETCESVKKCVNLILKENDVIINYINQTSHAKDIQWLPAIATN